MYEIMRACAGLICQLLIYFMMGSLLLRILKVRQENFLALIFGFILYFTCFEAAAVPATLAWVPLKVFSYGWLAFLLVICLLSVIFCSKRWAEHLKEETHIWEEHSGMLLLGVVVVLVQCFLVIFYQDSSMDSAYYVGVTSTSVYTGQMWRQNPETGRTLTTFPYRYVFSSYPIHNAVWSVLLNIHPLIQTKMIMSVFHVLIQNMIVYITGIFLFDNDKKKADLMVFFVFVIQIFSDTMYTQGTFFFTRTSEGKSFLANAFVFMVLMFCAWFWREGRQCVWCGMFLLAFSSMAFGGSAMTLAAVMPAAMLPVIWIKKKYAHILYLVVCMLPFLLYFILYYGGRAGVIPLAAS